MKLTGLKAIEQIEEFIAKNNLKAYHDIYQVNNISKIKYWLYGILFFSIVILFLPWTQNIQATGRVTTLGQSNRPQEINSLISGRIEKWYHKEGDFVKAGDTIVILSEIKPEYLDPNLIQNTASQLDAKMKSASNYYSKMNTTIIQKTALEEAKELKLLSLDNKIQQQILKISNDSAELYANQLELEVYKRQIQAADKMFEGGAISLVEYEKRKVNYRNSLAKNNILQNKLMQDKQELRNYEIEKNSVVQEYKDKIAKAEGEMFSSLSNAASSDAEVAKLKNLYANYSIRNGMYIIKAPQDGQIINAKKSGIGELVKEGDKIMDIVPANNEYAVEMFVEPFDLPLIQRGQEVRFVFDGFPAIVFSGWPRNSSGTFGGVVSAIESNINENGKFRILVARDTTDHAWPKSLKIGGGANGIALLKDVPVYYELWRNINGFPPEYYVVSKEEKKK
jgi:multidrug resistance efflux pump